MMLVVKCPAFLDHGLLAGSERGFEGRIGQEARPFRWLPGDRDGEKEAQGLPAAAMAPAAARQHRLASGLLFPQDHGDAQGGRGDGSHGVLRLQGVH